MSKIKSGIIGCGRIGCGFDDKPNQKIIRTHALAYFKNPSAKLVSLCDIDTKKLKKYGTHGSVLRRFGVVSVERSDASLRSARRPEFLRSSLSPREWMKQRTQKRAVPLHKGSKPWPLE